MKIFAAPLQGFTEAAWREAHHVTFGGIDAYYSPFARIERGEIRAKDLRDIDPANNAAPFVPQMIAATPAELARLTELFLSLGYHEADLNLGCPFPPITKKHRGSGILPYPDEVEALLREMSHFSEMKFSVKMRLGLESDNEWHALMPILNETPLSHITLHPRIGRQQYGGNVNLEAFKNFYEACRHPIIYNGDLLSIEDIKRVAKAFPKLRGIMLGRGLLSRPSLAAEYACSSILDEQELIKKVLQMHEMLFIHYSQRLQGDAQILSKLKPYWEYLLPNLDRRLRKQIKKATSLAKYEAAVAMLL